MGIVYIREREGNAEARVKYAYLRQRGVKYGERCRMRYWRWSKILRYFNEDVKMGREYKNAISHLRAIALGKK